MARRVSAIAVALMSLGFGANLVSAQNSGLERFDRQLEQLRREQDQLAPGNVPPGQRALLDYGAYLTLDYITVDDSTGNNHTLRQFDPVVYARLNFDGAQELFLRGRATYRDFSEGDSFSGRGDEWLDPDLDRAFYRYDFKKAASAYHGKDMQNSLAVQVGRDLIFWGNGLTMAQVIDGGSFSFSNEYLGVDLIAGVTPVRTIDFDSSRPGFDTNTRRGFYGIQLSKSVGEHRPYAYALIQQDYNRESTLAIAPTVTRFNYDSFYLGVGSTGSLSDRVLYGVELVYEGGHTLSNSFVVNPPFLAAVDQTENQIEAFAADFRLEYLVNDPYRTRLSTEFLFATGDKDRVLSTSTTFGGSPPGKVDNAFNAFGLINTGLAFAPSVSNIFVARVGVSSYPLADLKPFRRMQVGLDLFAYSKLMPAGPIDESTNDVAFLGVEPDMFINWQVTSDVTLTFRYGVFFPSSDAFEVDDTRHFFATSVTFGF